MPNRLRESGRGEGAQVVILIRKIFSTVRNITSGFPPDARISQEEDPIEQKLEENVVRVEGSCNLHLQGAGGQRRSRGYSNSRLHPRSKGWGKIQKTNLSHAIRILLFFVIQNGGGDLMENEGSSLIFKLSHPGSEGLLFAAETQEIKEKWITALKEAVTLESSNQSWTTSKDDVNDWPVFQIYILSQLLFLLTFYITF